jgi:hypothetical protein
MFSIADIESAGTKTLIGTAQLLTTKDVTGSEKANCAIYPQNRKFYQCTVKFNPTDNGLMPKKGISFYAETYNSIGTSILSKPMNLYPSLDLESFAQCIYSAQHDTGKEIVLIFTGILSDLASTVAIDKIDSSLKLGYKVYEKGIMKTNLAFIPNLILNGNAKETSKESLKSFTPDMAFDVLKTYRLKYGNVLFSDGEYAWQIGDVSESSSRFKRVPKASGLATLASGAIDLYLIKQKSNLRISSCELSSNN